MVSEADAPPPDTPVTAVGPSGSAVPLDAFSAVLKSFHSRVEVACGRKVGKKLLIPPLSSGEDSDPDSGSAVVGDPCPEGSDDVARDPSDSVEESSESVAAHEKALVGALIAAVRDTLKIEDPVGPSEEVSVPFGSQKPARTAKVFPYLSHLVLVYLKGLGTPAAVLFSPEAFFGALPF